MFDVCGVFAGQNGVRNLLAGSFDYIVHTVYMNAVMDVPTIVFTEVDHRFCFVYFATNIAI